MNVSSLLPGLPDEKGRIQILHIHTTKMRQYDLLHSDVDIKELAVETKNYSGAELEGLVRAAQSTAMNRHIKVRYLTFDMLLLTVILYGTTGEEFCEEKEHENLSELTWPSRSSPT